MAKRILHFAMAIMLIVFITSLSHSALDRSEPCPLCGARTQCIGEMRNRSIDRTLVSVSQILHCSSCDYDVMTP